MTSSVCVISANAISREGLASIFGSAGLHVAAAGQAIGDMPWDEVRDGSVALIDSMGPDEQPEAVAETLRAASGIRPVILAEAFHLEAMTQCFSNGAHGYIVKTLPCPSLIASIELVAQGQKVLPSDLAERLPLEDSPPLAPENAELLGDANLSQRELDVLRCLMDGHSNKAIARSLALSDATVKVHVKAILRKLRVDNRTQAAIWGTARGLSSYVSRCANEPAD